MSTATIVKRPRNNTLERKGVTFGPGTVRSFKYGSLARNGNNSVLPAPSLVAKAKPGNFNSLPFTKRPNGQQQTQPSVPDLAPTNARRQLAPVTAHPHGSVVIGASPASLWPTLSRPKGGRRRTRKRSTRKRHTRKRS